MFKICSNNLESLSGIETNEEYLLRIPHLCSNNLESLSGIETRHLRVLLFSLFCSNNLESLSGIETDFSDGRSMRRNNVLITLNPYQGLKHKSKSANPIYCSSNNLESLSGIETKDGVG